MSRPATAADLRTVDLFDDLDDDELAEWVRGHVACARSSRAR